MSHIVKKIQSLDDHVKSAEDRIAAEQVRIGNFKREREALFNDLSADEKKLLEPAAPASPAPAEPNASPASDSGTQESRKKKL